MAVGVAEKVDYKEATDEIHRNLIYAEKFADSAFAGERDWQAIKTHLEGMLPHLNELKSEGGEIGALAILMVKDIKAITETISKKLYAKPRELKESKNFKRLVKAKISLLDLLEKKKSRQAA